MLPSHRYQGLEGVTLRPARRERKGRVLKSESRPWTHGTFPLAGWEQPAFPDKSRCQLTAGLQPEHADQSLPLTCRHTCGWAPGLTLRCGVHADEGGNRQKRSDFTCSQSGPLPAGLAPHVPCSKPCHGKPRGSENRIFRVKPCQGWENSEHCLRPHSPERTGTERSGLVGLCPEWPFLRSCFQKTHSSSSASLRAVACPFCSHHPTLAGKCAALLSRASL